MAQWHTKSVKSIVTQFGTHASKGLTTQGVKKARAQYGRNELSQGKTDSFLVIFFKQFQSPFIYVLLAAGIIIALLEEVTDAAVIGLILFFNALIGALQEGKAQNIAHALRKLDTSEVEVIRDGKSQIIPDVEIVPGDLIVLHEGGRVPADARILSSTGLRIDESTLTGESQPVLKIPGQLRKVSLSVSDQTNMAFKGTVVVGGHGLALVVAIGISTVFGAIGHQVTTIDTEIPLKQRIRELSKKVLFVVGSAVGSVVIFGLVTGGDPNTVLVISVALAVSLIPEGLPLVLTLVLARGVWRMSKKQLLVKKLHAVEALGQVDVIAVDKTGTLTKNELVVRQAYTDLTTYTISGSGYEPIGEASILSGTTSHPSPTLAQQRALTLLVETAMRTANARVNFLEKDATWHVAGDPTEGALVVLSRKLGIEKYLARHDKERTMELPFDYTTKIHAVAYQTGRHTAIAVTGAPESVLARASFVRFRGETRRLTPALRKDIEEKIHAMSRQGLRVIACAHANPTRAFTSLDDSMVKELVFLGLFGIEDSLRPEVSAALAQAQHAKIKVVMITRDHAITARAIGEQAGIFVPGRDTVLLGEEIEDLSDAALRDRLETVTIFARVTPEHKLRIIEAYKMRGEIIAMTGDGVNDTPALLSANLGVAMGKIGTEAAKEAADMILLDDNFGNIITGVEEGRGIYVTIKKVILYLFSTSAGEFFFIFGVILLGFSAPLAASQIIWMNVVTNSFLDAALAMESKDPDLLDRTFDEQDKTLLDRVMITRTVLMGLTMAVGALCFYLWYMGSDPTKLSTVALVTLSAFQWYNTVNCRSTTQSALSLSLFSNKYLIGALILVVGLQLFAVYSPILQPILKTTPLSVIDWMMILAVSSSIILTEELRKWYARRTLSRTITAQ